MKIIKPLGIVGFDFEELTEGAKLRAINDRISSMVECVEYEEGTENFKRAIDKAESMRTPWFVGSYIYDYCKEEIIETIKINEYLFNIEGDLLPVTCHVRQVEGTKAQWETWKHTYRIGKNREIDIEIVEIDNLLTNLKGIKFKEEVLKTKKTF